MQYTQVLFLVGFVALFWFMIIRPQQKQQKTRQNLLASMKKGDRVVTIGGLHGEIVELGEETVILQVGDKLNLTFNRTAIGTVKGKE